jgi:hypothetical protein
MEHTRIVSACIGVLFSVGFCSIGNAAGNAAAIPASDDEVGILTNSVTQIGLLGTLTAPAAEKFGLEPRDYPEKYLEVGKSDGTLRSVELVSDNAGTYIFLSQRTAADTITVRSGASGQFVIGLHRPGESADVEELSGNQGRAFVKAELTYWLAWLTTRRKD